MPLSPPSGLDSEHEQICGQNLRKRYRMSGIYRHLVIAATRAVRARSIEPKFPGRGSKISWCRRDRAEGGAGGAKAPTPPPTFL